jgi:hypothetical protein
MQAHLCVVSTQKSTAYALLVLLASLSRDSFGELRTPDQAGRWHVGNHIDSDDHGVLCNLPGRGPRAHGFCFDSEPARRELAVTVVWWIVLVGPFAWTARCLR